MTKLRALQDPGAHILHDATLSEDAHLQSSVHEGQDAFVPDPTPPPIHEAGV